MLNTQSMSDSL